MIKYSLLVLLIFFSSNMPVAFAQMESEAEPVVIDYTNNKVKIPEKLKGFKFVNKSGDETLPSTLVIEKENNTTSNEYPEDMKDLFSTPVASTPGPAASATEVSGHRDKVNKNLENNNNRGSMSIYFLVVIAVLTGIIIYSRKKFIVRGNE